VKVDSEEFAFVAAATFSFLALSLFAVMLTSGLRDERVQRTEPECESPTVPVETSIRRTSRGAVVGVTEPTIPLAEEDPDVEDGGPTAPVEMRTLSLVLKRYGAEIAAGEAEWLVSQVRAIDDERRRAIESYADRPVSDSDFVEHLNYQNSLRDSRFDAAVRRVIPSFPGVASLRKQLIKE